jgi:phage terminase large subunit GpA-like protein
MSSTAPSGVNQTPQLLGDAGAAWRAGFAEGIKPTAMLTVSQWADSERILSSKEGDEPGPWRTDRTPYLREIMDCLSVTHPATDVVFKKSSQIGGTECGHNWLGYIVTQAPGATMYVLPSSDTSARTSKQRLAAMIDECPTIGARIKPARSRDSGNTTRMKEFPGGVLVLASSKSPAELKSMPIRYLYADEIDEYPEDLEGQGDALALAERRTGGRGRTKRFKTSTPTVAGRSRIDRLFQASDQRFYFMPCPHCAHEQRLVWDRMRWEVSITQSYTCRSCGLVSPADGVERGIHVCPGCHAPGEANEHTLVATATDDVLDVWYECEACSARIEEHHKPAMLAAGRWIAMNAGPRRPVGFSLNALYSPLGWYSWTQAVNEYLGSEGKPTLRKVWTNTVLGEPYEDSFEQPQSAALQQRSDTTYLIRTVPAGAAFLTAGVDVQSNRLELKVKAWGRGEESWLVDHQVLHGDPTMLEGPGTVWAQLDALLAYKYPHAGGTGLLIAATAVDTGYCTHTVYEYCRRRAARHVIAIKGSSQFGKAILGAPSKVDVDYQGRKVPEGVKLWPIGTDTAKELVYRRLNIEVPGPGCMHWPMGLPVEYFQQLTAEKLKRITNKAGYQVTRWEKDGTQRNEALDLEVYAYAAALYAGIQRVNWEALERAIQPAPVSEETLRPAPPPPPVRGRVLGRITGSPN